MQSKQLSKLECARIRIIKNQQSAYFELLEENWENLNMILKFIYSAAFRHLAPLVMFTDTLYSKDYQDILSTSILPFIREKLPFYHSHKKTVNLSVFELKNGKRLKKCHGTIRAQELRFFNKKLNIFNGSNR